MCSGAGGVMCRRSSAQTRPNRMFCVFVCGVGTPTSMPTLFYPIALARCWYDFCIVNMGWCFRSGKESFGYRPIVCSSYLVFPLIVKFAISKRVPFVGPPTQFVPKCTKVYQFNVTMSRLIAAIRAKVAKHFP